MTWRETYIDIPNIPRPIYKGIEGDAGLWLYQLDGKWTISRIIGRTVSINGQVAITRTFLMNGQYAYYSDGFWLWWTHDNEWAVTSKLGSNKDEDQGWWSCESLEGIYRGRGKNQGAAAKVVTTHLNGWQSDEFVGEYRPVGKANGMRCVGHCDDILDRWRETAEEQNAPMELAGLF